MKLSRFGSIAFSRSRRTLPALWRFCSVLGSVPFGFLLALNAHAAVTEPNGMQVPADAAELQSVFDQRGESLNAVDDAASEPSSFSPLCEFTGTLLYQEASCRVEFGWYNAEESPGVPRTTVPTPAEVFTLVPADAPLNTTFSGGDIRMSADYNGGLIGFAMRSDATGTLCQEYHFSESKWGRTCTACTPASPWITLLTYPSTLTPNAFYLTVEDGTTTDADFGNDGDFDDKVFLVEGITCPGGGLPCFTEQDGPCRPGITECTPEGIICKPLHDPDPEICDKIDNDCNGVSDDGDGVCPVDKVCFEGMCVGKCNSGEFQCPSGHRCDASAGVCVSIDCFEVKCPDGQVCRMGECVAPCDGIVCPLGQVCELGSCVDYCAGVMCKAGQVCEGGACLDHCRCRVCPTDTVCNPTSGQCVDGGCEDVSCDTGFLCQDGVCKDKCEGAVCPPGQKCEMGSCVDDPGTGGSGGVGGLGGSGGVGGLGGSGGVGGGGGTGNIIIDPDAGGGNGGTSGGAGSGAGSGAGGDSGSADVDGGRASSSSCGCRVLPTRYGADLASILGVAAVCLVLRRSRRGVERRGVD